MLEAIENFLQTKVKPIAYQLDEDFYKLFEVFSILKSLGILKILIPTAAGGFGMNQKEYGHYAIAMAKSSGALSLLQAQHQRAVSNFNILGINEVYYNIIEKEMSFAYYNTVKHQGVIKVSADKDVKDGFRLTGTLPWVTGFNLLDVILLFFCLANRRYLALIPFANKVQDKGEIICSDPIRTRILSSANNVSVRFKNWLVKPEQIIYQENQSEFHSLSELPSPPFVFVACSEVALEYVHKSKYFQRSSVQRCYSSIRQKLATYKEKVLEGGRSEGLTQLRTEGYPIARDATELARLACGAEVLLATHPVGRISLEMWQSAITGPREEQLDAYLK